MTIEFIGFDSRIWFKVGQKVLALAAKTDTGMWEDSFDNDVSVLDNEGYPIEICNFSEDERKILDIYDTKIYNKIPCNVYQEWEVARVLKTLL